jgi:hypothetical protein
MIQWEYKIEVGCYLNEQRLIEFGKEGWELCSVVFKYISAGGYNYYDYYFKRQITESK